MTSRINFRMEAIFSLSASGLKYENAPLICRCQNVCSEKSLPGILPVASGDIDHKAAGYTVNSYLLGFFAEVAQKRG